jgi:ribosome-associated toxin RatA of RatAB toxin-antitoxin module
VTPRGDLPACARHGTEFMAILRACGGLFSRVVDDPRSASLEIQKSALISHSAGDMFDLIEAAEHYPTFLPWCAKAAILTRDDDVVVAQMTVDYRGVQFSFRTRNPKRRPHWMAIHLEQGPFQHFEGEWRLTELTPDACKIEFSLRYEFGGALVGKLASRVFEGIASNLVDAFANRADQVLGRQQPSVGGDSSPTSGTTS